MSSVAPLRFEVVGHGPVEITPAWVLNGGYAGRDTEEVRHHVEELAAIGVPDDKSGEAVKVILVKKDPALTAQDIEQHCREQLTAYKRPRHIEFRSELPKSNVGKILRRELRPAS